MSFRSLMDSTKTLTDNLVGVAKKYAPEVSGTASTTPEIPPTPQTNPEPTGEVEPTGTSGAPEISTTTGGEGPPDIVVADVSGTPGYVSPTAPTFKPREISANETVEGRLNTLLDKDNPYIANRRQGALETAMSRGLQNSSIAAGAGERAAIEGALPIAQQDAQIYASAGQSAQDAQQTAGLEGYRGDISSELSTQQHFQAANLEEIAQYFTGNREDKENFVKLGSGIQQSYQDKYLEIQAIPDEQMSPAEKAKLIEALNRSSQSQFDMLKSIYGVEATWSGGITAAPGSGGQTSTYGGTPSGGGEAPVVSGQTTIPGISDPQYASSLSNISTIEDPTEYTYNLDASGAKESDDYFVFSSQDLANPSSWGLIGQPTAMTGDEKFQLYSAIMQAATQPWNEQAQADAIKAVHYGGRPDLKMDIRNLNPIVGYTDVSNLPPSQRTLSPWQEWVNRVIYNNAPPQ